MEIEVRFYAQLRQVSGSKSYTFSLTPGSSARQLLSQVIQQFPGLEPELFDERGELYGHVRVLINGHDLMLSPELADTILNPNDAVSIFPAIGGG